MSKRRFSSRWFRVYDEAADDPKMQMLSDKLHRFLFNLWCISSKHGGYLPAVSEVAWRVRMTEARVTAMLAELYERGFLDQEGATFSPHNWFVRQYENDVSTGRVREFRKRQKGQSETVSETDLKQDETVSETHQRQRQNRDRTETETEQTATPPSNGTHPTVTTSPPAFALDEHFVAFKADYEKTGGALIPEDWIEAYQWAWKPLDFEQRAERHKALLEKIEAGYFDNPAMVPRPRKFLQQEWKRPIPKSKSEAKAEARAEVWRNA